MPLPSTVLLVLPTGQAAREVARFMPKSITVVTYCQALAGSVFDEIIVAAAPSLLEEEFWLESYLPTKFMKPDKKIIKAY